jgi:hypothetical protein
MSPELHVQHRTESEERENQCPKIDGIFPMGDHIPLGPEKGGAVAFDNIVQGIDFHNEQDGRMVNDPRDRP